jgi:Mg2+-importing ATPase
MGFLATIFNAPQRWVNSTRSNSIQISKSLVDSAHQDAAAVLEKLNTTLNGLTAEEVEARLERYGLNEVAKEKRQTWLMRLRDNVNNPLVILLSVLGLVSYLTGDLRATVVIFIMVLLGIVLRYVQESRADSAAEKLKAMVSTTATASARKYRSKNWSRGISSTFRLAIWFPAMCACYQPRTCSLTRRR